MTRISAAIITWNEEKNFARAVNSIKNFVDEVVVVDMSTDPRDKTKEIAKKLGAKVFTHKYTGYVEPARNYSIEKSTGDWVFILDADEEIPAYLGNKLRSLTKSHFSYYQIPRKNIIFGKWIQHSRYWPDFLIRFFKKGSLSWPVEIHKQPTPLGQGKKLEGEEYAIIHHHYGSISEYLSRLDRYTNFQLQKLGKAGYRFSWIDLINRPTDEFISRFYAGQGYKDGIHGLALALLQSFSELVLYLKAWEKDKFAEIEETNFESGVKQQIDISIKRYMHWSHSGRSLQKIKTAIVKRLL